MAKPERSAPRRAVQTPAEQGAAAGAEKAETAAANGAPQHDRAPSGRVRPKRVALRRAARGEGKVPQAARTEARPTRPVRPAKQQRASRRPSWVEATSGPGAPLTAKQDRERATMAHFGVAVGFVAPLAIWLLYRDRGPFTAQEAKEALNFAVPPTLLMGVFFFLGQLPVLGPVFAIIGALIWMVMAFYGILGGSQVNKGRPYRYPFNLRILR